MGQTSKEENESKTKLIEGLKLTDIIFGLLFIITTLGTVLIFFSISDFRNELISLNPSSSFPKFSDLYITLISVPIFILTKLLIERIFKPISEKIISKRYTKVDSEDNFSRQIYVKKLSTSFFKLIKYIIITSFGFLILRDADFFPISMGGKGDFKNAFSKGYPASLFYTKPYLLDIYYMAELAFYIVDIIWLVLINERQSDFIAMLFHHTCSISLIAFSYFTNLSSAGSLVILLHDFGDIFVYITKITTQTDVHSLFKISSALTLTGVFIYTRLYILYF